MAASDYKNKKKPGKDKPQDRLSKRQAKRKRLREEQLERQDLNILSDYRKDMPPFELEHTFRFRAIQKDRHKTNRVQNITKLVTSCSWEDVNSVMTGTLLLQSPQNIFENSWQGIEDGAMIVCDVKMGKAWKNVWYLRVQTPSEDLVAQEGTFTLADDLSILRENEGDFEYKKTKKHPVHKQAWRPREVVLDILKTYHVKAGFIADPDVELNPIDEQSASPVDVIEKIYKQATDKTGKTYIMKWVNGALNIVPLTRQPVLYTMRQQIMGATITHNRGNKFKTALTVTASRAKKDSKKKDKIEVEIVDPRAVARYGYIHGSLDLKMEFDSEDEVRKQGKLRLARSIRKATDNTISLSHIGIPFVKRGDALRIHLPEFGFTDKARPKKVYKGGEYSVLYVKTVNHNLQSGNYTMDIEFELKDAFAEQQIKVREARDKARRKAKRKSRDGKKPAKVPA